jgi:hypothetical protein
MEGGGANVLRIIYEGCLVRSCDFAAILPCTDCLV